MGVGETARSREERKGKEEIVRAAVERVPTTIYETEFNRRRREQSCERSLLSRAAGGLETGAACAVVCRKAAAILKIQMPKSKRPMNNQTEKIETDFGTVHLVGQYPKSKARRSMRTATGDAEQGKKYNFGPVKICEDTLKNNSCDGASEDAKSPGSYWIPEPVISAISHRKIIEGYEAELEFRNRKISHLEKMHEAEKRDHGVDFDRVCKLLNQRQAWLEGIRMAVEIPDVHLVASDERMSDLRGKVLLHVMSSQSLVKETDSLRRLLRKRKTQKPKSKLQRKSN